MAKVERLIEKIVPQHYRLQLDVDTQNFSYAATEAIKFEAAKAGTELTFHAVNLDVAEAVLDGDIRAKSIVMRPDDQTVVFRFDDEIATGEHELKLKFRGPIQDSLHGFYRSRYEHEGQEKWLVTTQFEAVHAREAFVCVDEPSAKAVLELSLTVPEELTAVSNTNAVSEEPVGPGRKTIQFAPTPRMSTYLAAWVVGEFEYVEGTTDEGVQVRVFATPGRKDQLGFALDVAKRTLSFYTRYFGIAYPLPKLDMLAIPDFASGAMENWGAVTYRETDLLLDPAKTSLAQKQRVAEVVAHELAHQWFGNLVTMSWWDDLWLNEGFATWVAALARNELFPEWQTWTLFVDEEFAQAQELDSLANTHPIQVPVDDPRSLDEIFDAISYAKGASVINMMHHYLGAESFQKGLQVYLDRHKYSNTVTHDLWRALGEASAKPVDEVMSAWTSQPGYPLVSFEEGQIVQRRFYSSPREAQKAKSESVWPIPFSAILNGGRTTEQALIAKPAVDANDEIMTSEWFKPNPGQTAFYRTLYTQGMIDSLAGPLRDGTLGATDRFGVVNDVFSATEAGVTDSSVALKLAATLREEQNYIVWGGVTGGFGSLHNVVEDDALRNELDAFGLWLVGPNARRLGWQPKPEEAVFDTLMRPMVLQQAVRFDDEDVTAEARKRFATWAEGGDMDPNLRPAILYAAARHGGADEFNILMDRYRQEPAPHAKMSLLGALGRFRRPELMDQYLGFALTDDVRPQDIHMVLAWGLRNRDGRMKVWNWVKDNWELWLKRYGAGGHMLERFPLYAGMGFATHEMAREIKDFFEGHPHPSLVRPTAQAVESVELKADWYERDRDKIANFLRDWSANSK